MKRQAKQTEPPVPAVPIDKEALLVKELSAIAGVLDNMDNDWEKRAGAMRRLQGIAKGGAHRTFPAVFNELLARKLKEPLCKQFGDLRSSLVKEAATCVEALSAELGDALEPIVDALVEAVMTMLGTTNKVLQCEGNRAMVCILAGHRVNRSIAKICYFGLTSKVPTQRQYSIDYLGRIIRASRRYTAGFFERNLDEIEKVIKKALTDGIPSIRDLARSVFWDFYAAWEKRGAKILASLDPNTKKNLLKDDPRPAKPAPAKTVQDDTALQKHQKPAVAKVQQQQQQQQKFSITDPALKLAQGQIGDDDDIDDLFFSANPDVVGRKKGSQPPPSPQKRIGSQLSPTKQKKQPLSPTKQKRQPQSPQKKQLQRQPQSPLKQSPPSPPPPPQLQQQRVNFGAMEKVCGVQNFGVNKGYGIGSNNNNNNNINNNINDDSDDDEIMMGKHIGTADGTGKKKDLGRLSGMTVSFSAVSFRKGTGFNTDTPGPFSPPSPPPPVAAMAEEEGEGEGEGRNACVNVDDTAERINAFRKLNDTLKEQPEYEVTGQLGDILVLIKSSLEDEPTESTSTEGIETVPSPTSKHDSEAIGKEALELVLILVRKYHGYIVYNLDAILPPVFLFAVHHPSCDTLCGSIMDASLASFSQDIIVPLAFRMLRSATSDGRGEACPLLLTFILKAICAFPGYFHSVAKIKTYLPVLTAVATAAAASPAGLKATEVLVRIFEDSRKDFVIAFLSFSPKEYKAMRESLPLIIPGLNEELESYGTERDYDEMGVFGVHTVTVASSSSSSSSSAAAAAVPELQKPTEQPALPLLPPQPLETQMAVQTEKEEGNAVGSGMDIEKEESAQQPQMTVEEERQPPPLLGTGNTDQDAKKTETSETHIIRLSEEETLPPPYQVSSSAIGMTVEEEGEKENEEEEEEEKKGEGNNNNNNNRVLPQSPPQQHQESEEHKEKKDEPITAEKSPAITVTATENSSAAEDKISEISNTHSYSGDSTITQEKHVEGSPILAHNNAQQQQQQQQQQQHPAQLTSDIVMDFDITSNPSIVEGGATRKGGSSDVDSLLLDMDDDDDDDGINTINADGRNIIRGGDNTGNTNTNNTNTAGNNMDTLVQEPQSQPQPQPQIQQEQQLPPQQPLTPQRNVPTPQAGDFQVPISEDVSLYLEDAEQPQRIKSAVTQVLRAKGTEECMAAFNELLRLAQDGQETLSEQSAGAAITAVCSRINDEEEKQEEPTAGEGADVTTNSSSSNNNNNNNSSPELREAGLKVLGELFEMVPEAVPLDAMRQAFVAATRVMDECSAEITPGTAPMLRLSANVLVKMKSANMERYFQMLVGLCSSETTPRVLEAAIHNLSAFCSGVDKAFLTRQQGLILNSLLKPVNSHVVDVRKESTICLALCCALLPDNQFFVEKLKTKLNPKQMRLVTYYYNERMKLWEGVPQQL